MTPKPKVTPRVPKAAAHVRLRRRYFWQRRLLRVATVYCIGSILLFFLPESVWNFVVLSLVAWFLGFALPMSSSDRLALQQIDEEIGFSYRSYLELAEENPFKELLAERSHRRLKNVGAARAQAWWFPIGLLAALNMFAAHIGLDERIGNIWNRPQATALRELEPPPPLEDINDIQSPPETSTALNASENAERPREEPQEPQAENEGATQDQTFSSYREVTASEMQEASSINDSDALDRFLEQLEQNPDTVSQGLESFEQASEALDRDDSAELENDTGPDTSSLQNEDSNSNSGASTQAQEQNEQEVVSEGRSSQEQLEQEGDTQAEATTTPNDDSSPTTQEQASDNDLVYSESERQEAEAQQAQQERLEQFDAGGASSSSSSAAPSATEQQASDNEAGSSTSTDADAEGEDFDATAHSPVSASSALQESQLYGQQEEGPSTTAGVITGGPNTGNDTVSVEESLGTFQSSTEDAVYEGNLPVAYQEILRNYFK